MLYGILLAVFKLQDSTYCLVQGLQSFGGTPFVNEYDCPQLDLTTTIFIIPGKNIKRAVSIAHECDTSCCFKQTETVENVERQEHNLYLNMTGASILRRFFTSKGKPDRSALWPMNLISEYIDPYTLIKFIDHNADRSGLPLLVKKRL